MRWIDIVFIIVISILVIAVGYLYYNDNKKITKKEFELLNGKSPGIFNSTTP